MIAPAYKPVLPRFEYVREWDDRFLALFPHRGDYLWAEHPEPKKRPEWKTESTHLLTDRMIQKGEYLYGVRFGSTTNYLLTDIDIRSVYHPNQDSLAIARIIEVLEPLGLVECLRVSSSDSDGLHLYFPFEEAVASWAIALVAKTLLESKGFKLRGGQLELFPNPKPYSDLPINHNGHRLPLQQGSYLLNKDWSPIFTSQYAFAQTWQFAARRNQVSAREVERLAKLAQRKNYGKKIKVRGQKYLSDLNNDIEPGWTSSGQTQFLLGKIANRERVFHHALFGGSPLEGQALADRIVEVAQALPGYAEFCGHQHEIGKKAKEWARSAEQRYYPYGSSQNLLDSSVDLTEARKLTWNEQQSQEARDRIKRAIADLLEKDALPAQPTARRKALRGYGIGNVTLDKYRSLWHPKSLELSLEREYHPVEVNLDSSERANPLLEKEYHPTNTNKLYHDPASAPPVQEVVGILNLAVGESEGFSTAGSIDNHSQSISEPQLPATSETALSGPAFVRQILNQIAARSQRSKRDCPIDLPIPDEHYFAERSRQLELLDTSPPLTSASDERSSSDGLPAAASVREPNINGENLLTDPNFGVKDFGDVIAETQVQFQRLGWTLVQAKAWTAEQFGGRSRSQLMDAELSLMLEKLRSVLQEMPSINVETQARQP
jgi:hypothetical protein